MLAEEDERENHSCIGADVAGDLPGGRVNEAEPIARPAQPAAGRACKCRCVGLVTGGRTDGHLAPCAVVSSHRLRSGRNRRLSASSGLDEAVAVVAPEHGDEVA